MFQAVLIVLVVVIILLYLLGARGGVQQPIPPREITDVTDVSTELARAPGTVASQRDTMRQIVGEVGADENAIIERYAAAERAGEVERQSNDYDLNPEEYARRLLADGIRKGWLRLPGIEPPAV